MLWLMIWPVLVALLLWSTGGFLPARLVSSPARARIDQFLHDNLTFLALDSTTGP